MKGVKVNMDMVNTALLVVVLVLVVMCCVRQNEQYVHCDGSKKERFVGCKKNQY